MKKSFSGWIICIGALVASSSHSGCYVNIGGSSKERFERQVELSSPLEPGRKLVAKTSFGSISVQASDTDQCRVSAKIRANARTQAEAEEIAMKTKVMLEPSREGLEISVDRPRLSRNKNVGVNLTILVPKSTELDCRSAFGSIDIRHISANIKAHTSFAAITVSDVKGALDLTTSHGNIKGSQVTPADTFAKTSFASINFAYEDGEAGAAAAKVRAETSHGSINIHNLTAQALYAKTSFGSVKIACSERSLADLEARVHTSHGGITFDAPPEFAGSVDMSNSFGTLDTELPITVQGETGKHKLSGQIGEGSGRLRLRTRFGSIRLR